MKLEGDWLLDFSELEIDRDDVLGSGTYGTVYSGWYRGNKVAVKMLKWNAYTQVESDKLLRDFHLETEIMSKVRSPHVVYFFGACGPPNPCIVSAFMQNGSLYDVMRRKDLDLGWRDLLRFAKGAAMGMNSLHMWKPLVVHRDLKSLNLLVDENWAVRTCDFGLSRMKRNTGLATFKRCVGSVRWQAPELLRSWGAKKEYNEKVDVWSYGIVLWELVNRVVHGEYRTPYGNLQAVQVSWRVGNGEGPGPVPPLCPTPLHELISACLTLDAAARPSFSDIIKRITAMEKERTTWPKVSKRRKPVPPVRMNDHSPEAAHGGGAPRSRRASLADSAESAETRCTPRSRRASVVDSAESAETRRTPRILEDVTVAAIPEETGMDSLPGDVRSGTWVHKKPANLKVVHERESFHISFDMNARRAKQCIVACEDIHHIEIEGLQKTNAPVRMLRLMLTHEPVLVMDDGAEPLPWAEYTGSAPGDDGWHHLEFSFESKEELTTFVDELALCCEEENLHTIVVREHVMDLLTHSSLHSTGSAPPSPLAV